MTSARTARKQVPAIFKKVESRNGWRSVSPVLKTRINLDIGGGPYDDFTLALAEQGVLNLVYDPHNRSKEHNDVVLHQARNCMIASVTISNVLNVIKSLKEREKIIRLAAILSDGPVYITVYEGNKSSRGCKTRDGWQCNRRLQSYVSELKSFFAAIEVKNGMIVAKHPWNVWKKFKPVALEIR